MTTQANRVAIVPKLPAVSNYSIEASTTFAAAEPVSKPHVKFRRGANKPRVAKDKAMLGTILLIVLVLAVLGALPTWGYSRGWGYYPSGGLGLVLVIVLILVLIGRV